MVFIYLFSFWHLLVNFFFSFPICFQYSVVLLAGLRNHWLYSLQRGKNPSQKKTECHAHECKLHLLVRLQFWGEWSSISVPLPQDPLWSRVVEAVKGQINLFQNYLDSIGSCVKIKRKKNLFKNNYLKDININVQWTRFPNLYALDNPKRVSMTLNLNLYFSPFSDDTIGWDCRIHRLLLCRGVRAPLPRPQRVSWIWP